MAGNDADKASPSDRGGRPSLCHGRLIARIDCNRGSATWKTDGRLGLALGPLALTKAKCPPGSLHDRILGDWKHLRSYSMNKGNLLLLLKLDAGAYEFAPK